MSKSNLSYEAIEKALQDADAMTDPAEAHGTLCGMICISGKSAQDSWIEHALGEHDKQNLNTREAINILRELHEDTLNAFTEQSYDLELLIQDDEAPLDLRVDELSHWCQGFLYGLSLAGLTDIKSLPQDASEVLQDMMDISRAGFSTDDDEEENEQAFAEIVEYIRIGAYVVFNTFNSDDMIAKPITIH